MSRHRNVRSMRYEDDLEDEDVYGHSVEDDYCVSPSTEAQFLYDRNSQQQLASFISSHDHIEEIPEEPEDEEEADPLKDSGASVKPSLSDVDQAKLNSCLEEMRSILGDTVPDHVMAQAVVTAGFSYELALSNILSQQDVPKPQRTARENRRNKDDAKGATVGSLAGVGAAISSTDPAVDRSLCPGDGGLVCGRLGSGTGLGLGHVATAMSEPQGAVPSSGIVSVTGSRAGQQASFSLSALAQAQTQGVLSADSDQCRARLECQATRGHTVLTALPQAAGQQQQVNRGPISLAGLAQGFNQGSGSSSGSFSSPLRTEGVKTGKGVSHNVARAHMDSRNVGQTGIVPSLAAFSQQLNQQESPDSSPTQGFTATWRDRDDVARAEAKSLSLADLAARHSKTPSGTAVASSAGPRVPTSQVLTLSGLSAAAESGWSLRVDKPPPGLGHQPSLAPLPSRPPGMASTASQRIPTPAIGISSPKRGAMKTQHQDEKASPSLSALALQHLGSPSVLKTRAYVPTPALGLGTTKPVGDSEGRGRGLRLHTSLGGQSPGPKAQKDSCRPSTCTTDSQAASSSPSLGKSHAPAPPAKTVNLSDLASRHVSRPAVKPSSRPLHTDMGPTVTRTQPSMFAKTLCSTDAAPSLTAGPTLASLTRVGPSKFPQFAYHRQMGKGSSAADPLSLVVAFDFSTPSPDDIVKEKQKGGFGSHSSSARDGQKDATSAAATAPAIGPAPVSTQPAPTPTAGPAAGAGIPVEAAEPSQGLARMTFSSGKSSRKGFAVCESNGLDVADLDAEISPTQSAGSSTRTSAEREPVAMGTPKKELAPPSASVVSSPLPRSASKTKIDKMDLTKEYEKRKANGKDSINLVVIGHVDAGKSTLMGHVLYQMGYVNKRVMHKYEQEAKKMGKASFAYAWVLDETEEERTRGVTMDVAQTRFETESKIVNLLDAPGHKDFIPNMITGAAQADVATLVVNATRGEFETGFDTGGQTREHAMLIRSLGVSQLLVAVNKMDTVDWSQERFQDIAKKLGQFLKQAGFRESEVRFIPCSGLSGENLTKAPTEAKLTSWYSGPTVIDQIDRFQPPERPVDKPLRLCVCDIFKGIGAGISLSGLLQAGAVQQGDRVLVMPQGELATVRAIAIDDLSSLCAFAGDNITLTLTGIDMTNVGIGSVLCAPERPIPSSRRVRARIVLFNIDVPLTKGFPVVLHYQSLSEPARIRKLVSQLHKSTGEVLRKNPRCLTKNSSAVVELEVDRPICIELYKDFRDLGRFMLRYAGATIAAGVVTEIVDRKQ